MIVELKSLVFLALIECLLHASFCAEDQCVIQLSLIHFQYSPGGRQMFSHIVAAFNFTLGPSKFP